MCSVHFKREQRIIMLGCLLTLIWASASYACSQSSDLIEPILSVTHSAVSPAEKIQFNCTTNSGCCKDAEFYLYQNKSSIISSRGSVSGVTFQLRVGISHQGQYSCGYSCSNKTARVNSSLSKAIEIIVVNLQQPTISLWDPKVGFDLGPQGSVVTRGHSFTIKCSSEPQYPGGFFYLFNGPNIVNQSIFPQDVEFSALFSFSYADYSHQGNYSCKYILNVSARTFKSASSDRLLITVKASLNLVISALVSAVLLLFAALIIILLIRRQNKTRKVHFSQVHQGAVNVHLNIIDEEDDEDVYVNVKHDDENDYIHMNIVESDVSSDESENDYVNMNKITVEFAKNRS